MGSIATIHSSVTSYINSTSSEYSTILVRANETMVRVEKLNYEVKMDLDSIARQILSGKRMLDDIQVKEKKYKTLMDEASAEVDRCNEQIDYILSHPISRTYSDENGNDYTVEEINEVALAVARSARDRAVAEYEHYRDKHEEAISVKHEVSTTVSRYETIKSAIEKIEQLIQSYLYDIKKYISAIESESAYNIQNLNNLLDSIGAYLASKAIAMPSRVVSHSFASNGASGSLGSASGSALWSEVAADTATYDDASSTQIEATSYESADNAERVSERYFDKQSRRDVKSLSSSEQRHLQVYLNNNDFNPAYTKIKGHLVQGDSISDDLARTIDSMTNTISKYTLKRDMVLYRGIKRDSAKRIFGEMENQSIEELKSRFEGTTFIERGFSSTSIYENDALDNFVGFKGVLFEIKAPNGAEGIFTGSVAANRATEHEVLLQRGGVFSIDKISNCGDYYLVNATLSGRVNIR